MTDERTPLIPRAVPLSVAVRGSNRLALLPSYDELDPRLLQDDGWSLRPIYLHLERTKTRLYVKRHTTVAPLHSFRWAVMTCR
jgi:hypothetical protein